MLKYNISAYFIFPTLGFDYIKLSFLDEKGLLQNTYLKNNQLIDDLADCFMAIKYKDGYTPLNIQIDQNIKKTKTYLFSYHIDFHTVVYCFHFKPEYKEDIQKVIEGKYPQVSEEYKSNFVLKSEIDNVMEDTFCKQVFDNNVLLKIYYEKKLDIVIPDDMNYFTRMQMEHETLNNE
jgi:hypothetical protein